MMCTYHSLLHTNDHVGRPTRWGHGSDAADEPPERAVPAGLQGLLFRIGRVLGGATKLQRETQTL